MSFEFFRQINPLSSYEAHQVTKHFDRKKLEQLYCLCVEVKKKFPRAYRHLDEEINRRADATLQEVETINMQEAENGR